MALNRAAACFTLSLIAAPPVSRLSRCPFKFQMRHSALTPAKNRFLLRKNLDTPGGNV
jgi:hypothetical protein